MSPVNELMDCLEAEERARLTELRRSDPFANDVLGQVDRILSSSKFGRVQHRARDFLRFIVGKTLVGSADQIKETTIAISVFRESADFDPATNGKVRVAGADLRQRLAEYYESDGKRDPIEITMPQATYVPDIRDRRPSIAISLIENWHPTHDQDHLCGTISDDIAYRLGASGRVRVVRVRSLVDDVPSAILYGLRGSLEIREDLLRVNVSLASLTGSNVFWRSFEQHRDDVFKLTREIVGALLTSLHLDTEPTIGVAVARRKRS